RPYEGPRDQDRDRPRPRQRPRHGLDLRSHARLHRHQRLVPKLKKIEHESGSRGEKELRGKTALSFFSSTPRLLFPFPRFRMTGNRRMILVAAVALVDADGRVLIARRPERRPMAGLWEFPGGKVHQGETPERALIRELKEELGIDVTAS